MQLNQVLLQRLKGNNGLDRFVNVSTIKFGQSKIDEYDEIEILGKGTYGSVSKCIHRPTGSIVALKTFLFEVSPIYS